MTTCPAHMSETEPLGPECAKNRLDERRSRHGRRREVRQPQQAAGPDRTVYWNAQVQPAENEQAQRVIDLCHQV